MKQKYCKGQWWADKTWNPASKQYDVWGFLPMVIFDGKASELRAKDFEGAACWVTSKSSKKSKVILGVLRFFWDEDFCSKAVYDIDKEKTEKERVLWVAKQEGMIK